MSLRPFGSVGIKSSSLATEVGVEIAIEVDVSVSGTERDNAVSAGA